MWSLIFILAGVISAIQLLSRFVFEDTIAIGKEETNGVDGGFIKAVNNIVEQYFLPSAKYCISQMYFCYVQCSPMNLITFITKYVPVIIYTYKFIKDTYLGSRKRIKDRAIELEDLKLQIQIVDAKLLEKDADFRERAENLRRAVERLRLVRARVREAIASDESLRRVLDAAAVWDADNDVHAPTFSSEEDRESIIEILKELKFDYPAVTICPAEKTEFGRKSETAQNSPEDSVYSSVSDGDLRQDCRVRIVRVTNVCKIACLKHYMKQKRLRRVTKQTLLKKKMDVFTKFLNDCHKTLNMVVNTKLTIRNIVSHPLDVASQDAMGDYSKPGEFSDTDSDYQNNNDMFYDEYQSSWIQNPFKHYRSNYEEDQSKDHDSQDLVDVKFQHQNKCACQVCDMAAILEETNSQLAIEETRNDGDVNCDLITL